MKSLSETKSWPDGDLGEASGPVEVHANVFGSAQSLPASAVPPSNPAPASAEPPPVPELDPELPALDPEMPPELDAEVDPELDPEMVPELELEAVPDPEAEPEPRPGEDPELAPALVMLDPPLLGELHAPTSIETASRKAR